jgi:hypothetical protein
MNTTLAAAVVAATTLGAGVASAATVTFDFTSNSTGSFNPSYAQTEGGLTVTATAGGYVVDTIVSTTGRTVTQNGNGLGVDCIILPGLCDNQINGISADLLTLTFAWAVKLVSVTFTNVNSGDDFDFFVDGGLEVADQNIQAENPASLGFDGKSFSFGADALDDNFRISEITVSSVPLPASALLLLAGLAGLGAMARRRAA